MDEWCFYHLWLYYEYGVRISLPKKSERISCPNGSCSKKSLRVKKICLLNEMKHHAVYYIYFAKSSKKGWDSD